MEINNIAVIGAGVMGADVAFDLSWYGFKVLLKDLDLETLQKAKEKMMVSDSLKILSTVLDFIADIAEEIEAKQEERDDRDRTKKRGKKRQREDTSNAQDRAR